MYVAIICFIYLLTQIKKLKERKIRNKIIFSLITIILLTSFFWIPLLESKLSANYEVFKEGRMERTNVLVAFKLSFLELFITQPNSIMIYEVGLISILVLLFTPIAIKKLKTKYNNTDFYKFYIFSLITGIICLIMTLKVFPFEFLPSTLKMLQFSFRLLEFSSFFLAFVVAVNIEKLLRNIKYKDIIIIMILEMILTSLFFCHLHYNDNIDETKLWPAVSVTENTGRVHAGCASFEYLPSKAFENREYIEKRDKNIIILNGNVTIENEQKNGTNLSCDLYMTDENIELELPYIYYIGYDAKINYNNGTNIKLDTYETDKGFLAIKIPNLENGKLEVKYEGTLLMKISLYISILGTIILIFKFVVQKINKLTKKEK